MRTQLPPMEAESLPKTGRHPRRPCPKYLHSGARIRHAGGGGTTRLAVVEWGNRGGEIIDERSLSPDSTWQWVEIHRLLGPATNRLNIRFRLDRVSHLEVDDGYVYIGNESER
jgi:hypothetical protein